MLSQVSIFAENKKGRLQNITSLLQKENINIWGSITNDSAEYGIIRMVVSNPEHAEKVLAEAGYLCRLTEVLGVELDDEVGALNRLLISLEESNINVDYLYLSFNRDSGKPFPRLIEPPMTKSVSASENMAMSRNLRRRLRIMRPPLSDDIPLRFAGCSGWRPAPASFFADKKRKSIPVAPPVSVEVDRKRHRRRMCFPRCALKAVFRLKGVLPRG